MKDKFRHFTDQELSNICDNVTSGRDVVRLSDAVLLIKELASRLKAANAQLAKAECFIEAQDDN